MFAIEVTPAKDGLTFAEWMAKVDRKLSARYMGLTSADLPDYAWLVYYQGGESPADAIADFMEEYGEELGADA